MAVASKLTTTALRARIVKLWNQGGKTMAQIASEQGLARGSVGRLLWEARQAGQYVVTVDRHQANVRSAQAQRTNVGEAAYHARLDDMRSIHKRKSMNESPRPDTPD